MCRSTCQWIMYLSLSSSEFCCLFPILKIWSLPSTKFCFPFDNLKYVIYNILSIFIVVYRSLPSTDFCPYSDFCFRVFHLHTFVIETWRMKTMINIPPFVSWKLRRYGFSCRLPLTNSSLCHHYLISVLTPLKMKENTILISTQSGHVETTTCYFIPWGPCLTTMP